MELRLTPGRRLGDLKLDAAYEKCTEIARRQAKNFYYAFLALPKHKRNAICAVYAFMRHADDISDDDSRTRDERRADLAAWDGQPTWRIRPWYTRKATPSFLDALAAMRRILWQERITSKSPGAALPSKILGPLLDTLAEAA